MEIYAKYVVSQQSLANMCRDVKVEELAWGLWKEQQSNNSTLVENAIYCDKIWTYSMEHL
jgi:hypothetical protein